MKLKKRTCWITVTETVQHSRSVELSDKEYYELDRMGDDELSEALGDYMSSWTAEPSEWADGCIALKGEKNET